MPEPQEFKVHHVPGFTRVRQDIPEWAIEDTELVDAQNVSFVFGQTQKRWGFKTNAYPDIPGGGVHSIFPLVNHLAQYFLLVLTSSNLYHFDGTNWVSKEVYTASLDKPIVPAVVHVGNDLGIVYGHDGGTKFYNGSIVSAVTATGNRWFAPVFPQQRAFVGAGYQTNLVSITAHPTTSWMESKYNLGGGDPVTGVSYLGRFAVFLRRNSILVAAPDPATPALEAVENRVVGAGCVAPRSVQHVPGGIAYLGSDGIYVFNGSNVRNVGLPIRKYISRLNRAEAYRACAVVDFLAGEYIVFAPLDADDTQAYAFVWNYQHDYTTVWYFGDIGPVGAAGKVRIEYQITPPLPKLRLLGGSKTIAIGTEVPVFAVELLTGGGGIARICTPQGPIKDTPGATDKPIDAWIQTKFFDFGSRNKKRLYQVGVYSERVAGWTITMEVGTSDDGVNITWHGPYTVDLSGSGRILVSVDNVPPAVYYTLKFRNNAIDQDLILKALDLFYTERGVHA